MSSGAASGASASASAAAPIQSVTTEATAEASQVSGVTSPGTATETTAASSRSGGTKKKEGRFGIPQGLKASVSDGDDAETSVWQFKEALVKFFDRNGNEQCLCKFCGKQAKCNPTRAMHHIAQTPKSE